MDKIIFLRKIKSCFEKQKSKKRVLLIKKVRTLYKAAYDYYLTLYLVEVEREKKIDFPAFMYLSGNIICQSAASKALDAILINVISQGTSRINKCYKSYLKYRRSIIRGC